MVEVLQAMCTSRIHRRWLYSKERICTQRSSGLGMLLVSGCLFELWSVPHLFITCSGRVMFKYMCVCRRQRERCRLQTCLASQPSLLPSLFYLKALFCASFSLPPHSPPTCTLGCSVDLVSPLPPSPWLVSATHLSAKLYLLQAIPRRFVPSDPRLANLLS